MDLIYLYYDNNGAITQANQPITHQQPKHILRRYHLIIDIIDKEDAKIYKVPTVDNVTNQLINPLAQEKHDSHTSSMGIRCILIDSSASGRLFM